MPSRDEPTDADLVERPNGTGGRMTVALFLFAQPGRALTFFRMTVRNTDDVVKQ